MVFYTSTYSEFKSSTLFYKLASEKQRNDDRGIVPEIDGKSHNHSPKMQDTGSSLLGKRVAPTAPGGGIQRATVRFMGVDVELEPLPSGSSVQPPSDPALSTSTSGTAGKGTDQGSAAEFDGQIEANVGAEKSGKVRLTVHQTKSLEEIFERSSSLSSLEKDTLAAELGLQRRQVEIWFQNRRARTKLKRLEKEAGKLTQQKQVLQAENDRLRTELKKLKLEKREQGH